jgi:hypothetical protein
MGLQLDHPLLTLTFVIKSAKAVHAMSESMMYKNNFLITLYDLLMTLQPLAPYTGCSYPLCPGFECTIFVLE